MNVSKTFIIYHKIISTVTITKTLMKSNFAKTIAEIVEVGIIGLVVIFFVYLFAGQPLRVTGDSMVPNFYDGEQIIAEKISIKTGEIERGDIVIFKHPTYLDRLVIKRVVGLPNEKISLNGGRIYVDGRELIESYIPQNTSTKEGTVIMENSEYEVPQDGYILLGDNRENSTDSRNWGAIKRDLIVGKGFVIYYPLDKVRVIG
ncbi:MAG: Signal peptidase I [candidate division WWE3 bacterium GW2011_GWA1_41_8]|uniref:Signal peptidase I n=1 Tax=candidate division WWE3 bacterium GW2011_GWA1_41_8 TaxID=1619103 RepID=A0A0G0XAN7_UNCKA|nr:MAG: Signal peptidase I [candidate division WWE3 bacterium GW2011_GWA1_41_8]